MEPPRHRFSGFRWVRMLTPLGAALALTACLKPFDVNVNTPEPIRVDVSMDVNVYQHGQSDEKKTAAQAEYRSAMDSRRLRMSEIQELKNNRLVGENHEGTLTIKNRPAGEYGDYVETSVTAENKDRETLMSQEAVEKSVPVDKIREEQWHHWQRKSFPGEWIEVANENGQGYRWEQKKAAGDE